MPDGPDELQQRLDDHEQEVQDHLETEVRAVDDEDEHDEDEHDEDEHDEDEETEPGEDPMEGEAPSG